MVVIRRLGTDAADLSLGQALVREYVEYTCEETGITLDTIIPHIDDYHDYTGVFTAQRYGFLVADEGDEDDGEVVGSVGWRRIDDERCSMNRLWVRPGFRRGGVARALCEAVMDAAAGDGYTAMLLDVTPIRTGAIALYQSLGFVETDPVEHYEFPMRYFARTLAAPGEHRVTRR
jgi:ribosomal protein S18 acetylase RimI-like enzyme